MRRVLVLIAVAMLALPASATVAIIYPDGSRADGYVQRNTQNSTLASLLAGAGTGAADTDTAAYAWRLENDATTAVDQFRRNSVGVLSFNKSVIPNGSTINSATVYMTSSAITTGLGTNFALVLTGGTLLNNTDIAAADYQNRTSTAYSDNVSQSSMGTNTSFALNSVGVSAISNPGNYLVITIQSNWTQDGIFGGTWASNQNSGVSIRYVDYSANPGYRPRIEINYTAGESAPVAGFTSNVTSGNSPLAVQFNDTSTSTPTNWDWYVTKEWANETKSSDDQNYTAVLSPGLYNVRLYASNGAGGDWENKTANILVNGTKTLVMVGDSLCKENRSYAPELQLKEPDWTIINTCEGGWETINMYNDYDVHVAIYSPDYITFEGGTNDIFDGSTLETIKTRILNYETQAAADGVSVYYHTISARSNFDAADNIMRDDLNDWIRCNLTSSLSNRYYIDLYDILVDPTDPDAILPAYTDDGVHPNPAGSTAWGNAINTSWPSISPSCEDTTPPASITALTNTSVSCSQLFFNWTTPIDADYGNLMIWRNNTALTNLSNTTTGVSWTGLPESTDITFSSKTCDLVGNCNATFVNMTKNTGACGVAPTAAFSASDTTVCTVDTVTFTDASINSPTTWNWSFGDGNVSALQNPTKIFNITGTYTINLTVNNTYGADSEVKTNYIVVSECAAPPTVSLDSDFTSNVTCGNVPFYVMFNDTSAGTGITTWNWSFGEGNYSDLEDDINLYSTPGLYTVRHSVADGLGNVSWENRTGAIRAVPDWITCAAATGTGGGGSGNGSEGIAILFGVVGGILGTIIIMRREKT